MDYRQRFMNTMLFRETGNVPFHEIAAWPQTLVRWRSEGAPEEALRREGWFLCGDDYFGFEPREFVDIRCSIPMPAFKGRVLSEDERVLMYSDSFGVVHRSLKNTMSMDQLLSFPVTDRASFRRLKKRFHSDVTRRYPAAWDDDVRRLALSRCPVCLGTNGDFGFYSMLRRFLGTEGISYMFFDDPLLVEEMLDFFCEYIIGLTHRALHDIRFDYFNFWEDMSYKNGPLVSPEIFRKFFLPRYKKLVDHLRSHGVQLITLDTDGDPRLLIPLFLEAGVNALWPVEVTNGHDPIVLRKEYGRDLALMGGIDKKVLSLDKKAIEYELKRILDYMLPRSGYIPTVDHAVPPDVCYENFIYYLQLKKELISL